jgi:hypothetical protein
MLIQFNHVPQLISTYNDVRSILCSSTTVSFVLILDRDYRKAIARPIPLLPPVINIVFPFSAVLIIVAFEFFEVLPLWTTLPVMSTLF